MGIVFFLNLLHFKLVLLENKKCTFFIILLYIAIVYLIFILVSYVKIASINFVMVILTNKSRTALF